MRKNSYLKRLTAGLLCSAMLIGTNNTYSLGVSAKETESSVIQPGTVWKDTDGEVIQAHGGSIQKLDEGEVNKDLDGDGQITSGKEVYLWYGEDKTHNTRPVDGVKCYSSTDLINWKDHGTVLYLQNQLSPAQVDSSGNKLELSTTSLETLKEWGKLEAPPEGVSQEQFDEVKKFLRAYVTEFTKEPESLEDTSWTAASYDETPIQTTDLTAPNGDLMSTTTLELAFQILYGRYCVAERPKMMYNSTTGKFVIAYHADGPTYDNSTLVQWVKNGCKPDDTNTGSRYSRALIGFAESDTPFGPFKLVNATRMNWVDGLNDNRKGESRDMTVFVDKGVDANNDGVDDAYAVYSSEMNAKMYISLLNKDYTGPLKQGSSAVAGEDFTYRVLKDNSREAPTVFKSNGTYYMLTSGTDGWNSTKVTYYRSDSMFGQWEAMDNPCVGADNGKGFDSQPTYVIEVDAEKGQFIYMGDRWNGNNLGDSRYVWLPIQLNGDQTIKIKNYSEWDPTNENLYTSYSLEQSIPVNVVYTGQLPENLPQTVKIQTSQGEEKTVAVTWNLSEELFQTPYETVEVEGVIEGMQDPVIAKVQVIPEGLQYFIDSGASEEAPEYNAVKNTVNLLNDKFDQASDGTNWGYIADGMHVKSGTDINDKFATGLYQDKADLTYVLPLSAGTYTVTAGYREWWNITRPTTQSVVIPAEGTNDGVEKVITGNDINLSGSNWKITADPITFTLDKDATVVYKASAKGSQKPVISWIAVAGEKKEETTDTVNKNALQTMIEKMEELNEKDYSTASWNVLQECLSAAKDVYANENATQAVVDQAYLDLVTAWKDLEVGLNTSAAEAVIKEAEAVLASPDLSEYRPSSVQAVRDSLDAVKAALANPETTQEQLNDTVTQLIDALIQLQGIINADALQNIVDLAEELLLDKDRYTTDTVAALEEALEAAKAVIANGDRTQQQIDDAYEALTNAIAGLVVRGDKSVLEPLIEKAEEILANTDAYTSSSLEGLAEVFASAKEVYDDVDAVQTEINTAAANLAVELSQVRILGDVNNDQKVDTADAAEVLKASIELIELSEADKDAADIKQDGVVDTADAALIEQYAAELITEF